MLHSLRLYITDTDLVFYLGVEGKGGHRPIQESRSHGLRSAGELPGSGEDSERSEQGRCLLPR